MSQFANFMIEAPDLGKSVGGDQFLRGVDLSLPRISIFSFPDPNRSRQTTQKKALLGLIQQTTDQGSIFSLLPVIGAVGLIVTQSLFSVCLSSSGSCSASRMQSSRS